MSYVEDQFGEIVNLNDYERITVCEKDKFGKTVYIVGVEGIPKGKKIEEEKYGEKRKLLYHEALLRTFNTREEAQRYAKTLPKLPISEGSPILFS